MERRMSTDSPSMPKTNSTGGASDSTRGIILGDDALAALV